MMNSRSKNMLTMALNKEFQEKISEINKNCIRKRKKVEKDDDYNDKPAKARENTHLASVVPKKKIIILSNVIIKKSDDTTFNSSTKTCVKDVFAENGTTTTHESSINVIFMEGIINTILDNVFLTKDIVQLSPEINEFEIPVSIVDLPNTFEFAKEILELILTNMFATVHSLMYTKTGEKRKRRKFELSVGERKKIKLDDEIATHSLKEFCKTTCTKKCIQKINQERRLQINSEFWKQTKKDRNMFVYHHISQETTKRKTTGDSAGSRRKQTFKYNFLNSNGTPQDVCKVFFLGTLGYEQENDRVIRSCTEALASGSITPQPSKKNKNRFKKIDRKIIIDHINTFNPTVSHYRREHAPKRRYLPSDITIKLMYEDFKCKHPQIHFSYYLYREVIADQNVSFVKLGHEECWTCEEFDIHGKKTGHNKKDLETECKDCQKWKEHNEKYTAAREVYKHDSETGSLQKLTITADLQKVIMLPRCDMFKEVIFTPRLIAFNESFVPAAGSKHIIGPTAILWHEAIAGRSKQDLASTFHAFFLSIRDTEHVVLWLDNCAAQNKNWCLYSFFTYLINSGETNLKLLEVKYFEPGHSFMAADSFHHMVETSLKRMGKVYDFADFMAAVKRTSKKTNIIEMSIEKFYLWQDYTSQYKLSRISPRPYLNKMVQVNFEKGSKSIKYKIDFDGPFQQLNFITAKAIKGGMRKPLPRKIPRGISLQRRKAMVSKLTKIMPDYKKNFWINLPVTNNEENSLSDEDDD